MTTSRFDKLVTLLKELFQLDKPELDTLVMAILEHAEHQESRWSDPPQIEGVDPSKVHYHVELCEQAGYLYVKNVSTHGTPYPRYVIGRLTYRGHEELKRIRDGLRMRTGSRKQVGFVTDTE